MCPAPPRPTQARAGTCMEGWGPPVLLNSCTQFNFYTRLMSASQNHIPSLPPPPSLLLTSPPFTSSSSFSSSPVWPRLPPCVLVWSLRLCGVSGRLESPARTLYLVPVWPPCHIINRCSTSPLLPYYTLSFISATHKLNFLFYVFFLSNLN